MLGVDEVIVLLCGRVEDGMLRDLLQFELASPAARDLLLTPWDPRSRERRVLQLTTRIRSASYTQDVRFAVGIGRDTASA